MAKKITLNIGEITNGSKPCINPVILVVGTQGELAFPCTDKVKDGKLKISLPDDVFKDKCIKIRIQCEKCSDCGAEFDVCLCSKDSDCKSCEKCVGGICISKCKEGQKCKDNTCCDCENNDDCPKGFNCNGCGCYCAGKVNDSGGCVECVKNGDCGPCQICLNGNCEDIICPNNLVCVGNGTCGCPAGTKYDATTNSCIPIGCDEDSDCGSCSQCVGNQCQPIVCPEGYKCVDGECIYWPCVSTSCENGGDCGPECGCVVYQGVRQCVPCYILECLGLCEEALGCRCNGTKCEPVDNCNQPCDGLSPCLDPRCTCYNGNCINCENFPCSPDDCTTRVNCGCTGGDCGGGFGCTDSLVLAKTENCADPKGCAVKATFTPQKECSCEAIRFDTRHRPVTLVGTGIANKVADVVIVTELFKGNVPYADYLNQYSIGDNEFVEGTVKVVIKHYTVSGGVKTEVFPSGLTPVSPLSILDNKVSDITLKDGIHFKSYSGLTIFNKLFVEIRVYAENVRIPNNRCVDYGTSEIYSLDLLNVSSQLVNAALLATNNEVISTSLNDSKNKRLPLFIWSKSSTSEFSTNKEYKYDGTYNQNGWFRKQYGVKIGDSYIDLIDSPEVLKELTANYNYKVQVDCGCKANAAYLNKLVFCCTEQAKVKFTKCNTEYEILPFDVCNVNTNLDLFETSTYKLAEENQTKFSYEITFDDASVVGPLSLDSRPRNRVLGVKSEENKSISKITVFQNYSGGLLGGERLCVKEFIADAVSLPDVVYTVVCDNPAIVPVTINQTVGTLIDSVEFLKRAPGGTETSFINGTYNIAPFTATTTKNITRTHFDLLTENNFILIAKINFRGGCITRIPITCGRTGIVEAAPSVYGKGNCPSGTDPDLVATAIGFGSGVQYSLDGVTFQSSNVFPNKPVGTYTVTFKEGLNTATATIEILAPITPEVELTPATICQGQTSTLKITALATSQFRINRPDGGILTTTTIGGQGFVEIPGLTQEGTYTITQTNVLAGTCESFEVEKELTVGGQSLEPAIELQAGTYCVGQPIPFRIVDGGIGASYVLTSNGSGTVTTPLVAGNAYNGVFTPNTTSGIIRITGVTDTCNTTTTPQISVVSQPTPTIINAVPSCNLDNTHKVVVTTAATTVTIGGIAATNTGSQTWERTNITGLTEIEVVVSNGTCTATETVILQNCACPTGTVDIIAPNDGITCGQGTINVSYNGSTLPVNNSWDYQFQIFSFGSWVDVNVLQSFALPAVPTYAANTSVGQVDLYRIRIVNPGNGCEYFSDSFGVTGIQAPTGVTITPSISGDIPINTPVQFTTQTGYQSYLWGGAVSGITNVSNTIQFSTPGSYSVNVTVCTGQTCCVTQTLTFNVVNNCTNAPTIQGITGQSCSDITFQVVGGTGARTYSVQNTYININSTAVPNNGTVTIPVSAIPAGETTSLDIVVIDSLGCTGSAVYSYSKCGCICDGLTCQSVLNTSGIAGQLVTYTTPPLNTDLYVFFGIGGLPDRLTIERTSDSQLLLDTLQLGNASATTRKFTHPDLTVPQVVEGGSVASIAVGASISTISVDILDSCLLGTTAGTKSPTLFSGVIAQRSLDQSGGNVGVYIRIPTAVHNNSPLLITGIPMQLEKSCTSLTSTELLNAAGFVVSCDPITYAGTI